ncbi:MAG: YabP/YqfC family sporulation protein [Clostridia bacterium]|nr:YabP/YqfC family sporulation protein [Clostridia bacterium]
MENKIVLENRKILSVTGVTKVKTATETNVELILEEDNLVITGNEMHITKFDLDSKIAEVTGEITSMKFGKVVKGNLLKKVFK